MSDNSSDEIVELKKRIYQLEQLVQKQNKIITKTGQNVLELQMDKQRQNVSDLNLSSNSDNVSHVMENNKKSSSSSSNNRNSNKFAVDFDTTDFVTNDDLVQLVGELQIELNNIEERSIRRMINCNKSNPMDVLAPLPNPDGDTPCIQTGNNYKDEYQYEYDYGFFPRTVNDFINIDDFNLIKLAKFYECLPPTLNDKLDLNKFLDEKIENLSSTDNTDKTFSNDVLITDEQIERELKDYSRDQLDDIFNDVARYLGLRNRRGTDIW